MKVQAEKVFALVCGTVAAILIVATKSLVTSQTASAKPDFAAQTGKPCGTCHQNAAGGGALKLFGQKIQGEWL